MASRCDPPNMWTAEHVSQTSWMWRASFIVGVCDSRCDSDTFPCASKGEMVSDGGQSQLRDIRDPGGNNACTSDNIWSNAAGQCLCPTGCSSCGKPRCTRYASMHVCKLSSLTHPRRVHSSQGSTRQSSISMKLERQHVHRLHSVGWHAWQLSCTEGPHSLRQPVTPQSTAHVVLIVTATDQMYSRNSLSVYQWEQAKRFADQGCSLNEHTTSAQPHCRSS